MPASSPSLQASRLMGGWVVDISDRQVAEAALARCRAQAPDAGLEVRSSMWGVQVRTDSLSAAGVLTGGTSPSA